MTVQNRFGELLVKTKVVKPEQLKEALLLQKGNKKSLGQLLVERGWCTEQQIVQTLSVALKRKAVIVKDAMISQHVVKLVPKSLAVERVVLPVLLQNMTLYVAMENPLDIDAIQQIEFRSGKQVIPLVAASSELREAIRRHYNVTEYVGNLLENVAEEDDLQVEPSPGSADERKTRSINIQDESERNEIVKLSNLIFLEGIKARASDIHIEPAVQEVKVRYRIDGMMSGGIKLPQEIYVPLLTRIKVLSEMDITEHKNPQNGHVRVKYQQRRVDLRVSTMLTTYGEKVVIRVLDKDARFYDISRLGLPPEQLSLYNTFIQQPQGLILVTGPTGSGKTTTLYALLNAMKDGRKHIVTIEDPIEYQLDGITQIQVNPKMGLTFASGLRTAQRQDPNVILVGEIRDAETASVAIQAVETGHLVLSTLHTTDAVATVNRLVTVNISPDLVASNLLVAVAQRLVRRICPRCRKEYRPTHQELQSIGLHTHQIDTPFYKGEGCRICRKTGYYGQIGIYEMFIPNDQLRREIAKRMPKQELKRLAIAAGMKTILEDGIEKVRQGLTTIEEIVRVCYVEQAVIEKSIEDFDASKPVSETIPPVKTVRKQEAVCGQCGSKLDPAWRNCPFCGTPAALEGQEGKLPEDLPPQIDLQETIEKPGRRIVVAEDDADTRKMLKFLLQRQGYQVILAVDGEDALEKIEAERPDLVILDINMPKKDGLEVCQAMRSTMETMFIPVILLTANDSIESKLQGLALGADDYITKPFHPAELLARIESMMRRTAQQASQE